ncbi:hypothetical protein C8R43DRAFT_1162772 [Mycena crocata]|nr:hypothetical protein C8R43DRAFT_1162772 [Mycena crocata]
MDATMALLMRQNQASMAFETHVKSLMKASKDTISGIDSQMRDLARLRERERGIIATLRSAIVPVHKLPAELLVETFLNVVPGATYDTWAFTGLGIRDKEVVAATLILSQVSAYWRKIAITTPRLWRSFFILDVRRKPTDPDLTILKLWLDRSSPLPIPVSVTSSLPSNDIAPLLQTLLHGASRWSGLTLKIESLASLPAISPLMSNLIHVNFQTQVPSKESTIFTGTPSLQWAVLSSRTFVSLPWVQLTSLTFIIHNLESLDERMDILRRCVNLISVHIYADLGLDDEEELGVAPDHLAVVLPNLTLFQVSADHVQQLTFFLQHISSPSLESFFFSHRRRVIEWPPSIFTDFQRKSPTMTHIALSSIHITSAQLINVLRNSPLIQYLNLEKCLNCVNDAFFDALRYQHPESSPLAPELTILCLIDTGKSFKQSSLERTIRSR